MHGRDGGKNLKSINQLFEKHTKYEGLKKVPSSRLGRVDFPSGQVTVHWARAQASCLSTKGIGNLLLATLVSSHILPIMKHSYFTFLTA